MHIRFHQFILPLSCAFVLSACPAGDDSETGGEVGSGDTTGDATTASSSASSSASTTTATTSASTTTATTSGDTTSDTDVDTGTETGTETGGVLCGDTRCAGEEWCDWTLDSCGDDRSDVATCMPGPEPCPPSAGDQVCGCDGSVYTNECDAQTFGLDVHVPSDCATPAGYFVCGYKFCDPIYSYCAMSTSDIGGTPDSYACVPLPKACGDTPSCECLADEPCADFSCEATADGGLEVICPGG
jgi:Kazal-type serine protease inhibitor domain